MRSLFKRTMIEQPAQFIARLSTLLQEGYTFEESIRILSPYHVKDEEQFTQLIQQAFLDGKSPVEILALMGIKNRFLYAISIAQSTGDLATTLRKISEDMQFYELTRERLKKLLYYPAFLFVFICGLFLAYRLLFLPRMQLMMYNRSALQDAKSLRLSQLFLSVPDYIVYSAVVLVLFMFITFYVISKKDIRRQIKLYSNIPFVGRYFQEVLTEQLSRELGNLLLHGFSLQEALLILQQQKHQKYITLIASDLLLQVKNGENLSSAVRVNEFLLKRFVQFIVHGEHSGTLGRELLIFSDLLKEKLHGHLNNALKIIQPALLAIIAICVLAAYLSILLPIYNMIEFV